MLGYGLLTDIALTIVFFFIIFSLMSVVMGLLSYLADFKKLKVMSVRYLFWKLSRDQDTDKMSFQRNRFMILFDMKCINRRDPDSSEDASKNFVRSYIKGLACIVLTGILFIVPFFSLSRTGGFIGSVGRVCMWCSVVDVVCMFAIACSSLSKGSKFQAVLQKVYVDITSADDIAAVGMQPLESYKDMKKTSSQETSYQVIRFIYGQCRDDITIMDSTAVWMEFRLPPKYNSSYDSIYYCLFAYYSTYKIDPEKARRYYDIVKDISDSNENSRAEISRAYYEFNINNDPSAALEHVRLSREKLTSRYCILKKVEKDNVLMLCDRLENMISGGEDS